MLTRRDIARYGLAGALLVGFGGVGLALRGTVPREPRRALQVLTLREYAILAAIADRVAPANGLFPAASAIEVPERIDDLLASSDPALAVDFGRVLALVENALPGLIFDGRTSTFSACDPEAQDRILAGWRESRLPARRMLYKGLVGLISGTYYSSPETWAAVGYPGPPAFGNLR